MRANKKGTTSIVLYKQQIFTKVVFAVAHNEQIRDIHNVIDLCATNIWLSRGYLTFSRRHIQISFQNIFYTYEIYHIKSTIASIIFCVRGAKEMSVVKEICPL